MITSTAAFTIISRVHLATGAAGDGTSSVKSDVATNPLAISMIVVGVVFLGILMSYSIRGRAARRAGDQLSGRELIDSIKKRAHGIEDQEQTRAAMLDETQRFAAAIDNKTRRLEMLLGDADRAIGQLTTLREQVRLLVERSRPHANTSDGVACQTETKPDTTRTSPSAPVLQSSIASARAEIDALMPELNTLTATRDPLTSSVYDLADAGHSSVEIARELDEQTGKIELILALRAG